MSKIGILEPVFYVYYFNNDNVDTVFISKVTTIMVNAF